MIQKSLIAWCHGQSVGSFSRNSLEALDWDMILPICCSFPSWKIFDICGSGSGTWHHVRCWKLMVSAILAAFSVKMLGRNKPSCQWQIGPIGPFRVFWRIRAMRFFKQFQLVHLLVKHIERKNDGCDQMQLWSPLLSWSGSWKMFGRTSSHTKMAQAHTQPSYWSFPLCSNRVRSTTDWDFLCILYVYLKSIPATQVRQIWSYAKIIASHNRRSWKNHDAVLNGNKQRLCDVLPRENMQLFLETDGFLHMLNETSFRVWFWAYWASSTKQYITTSFI